jgi:hypothetical protein
MGTKGPVESSSNSEGLTLSTIHVDVSSVMLEV